jgi:hypothetical protein
MARAGLAVLSPVAKGWRAWPQARWLARLSLTAPKARAWSSWAWRAAPCALDSACAKRDLLPCRPSKAASTVPRGGLVFLPGRLETRCELVRLTPATLEAKRREPACLEESGRSWRRHRNIRWPGGRRIRAAVEDRGTQEHAQENTQQEDHDEARRDESLLLRLSVLRRGVYSSFPSPRRRPTTMGRLGTCASRSSSRRPSPS